MRRDCKKCSEREKHFYWHHLDQTKVCFYKMMNASSFMKTLDLPNDFRRNFKGHIGENVELKGPSGNIWRVGVIKSAEKFTFQSGWKNFVIANNVEANDLLVFKYRGNSSFQVQVFAPSGCERTSSFFAGMEEIEVQESSDCSIKVFDGPGHNVHRDEINISGSSSDSEYSAGSTLEKPPGGRASNSSSDSVYSPDSAPVKIPGGCARREAGTSKEPNGQGKFEAVNNEQITFPKRSMTPAQKERVLKLSERIQWGNHCFPVVIKPTMIAGPCKYAIPMKFASKFLPQHPKNASLHYKGC